LLRKLDRALEAHGAPERMAPCDQPQVCDQ